MGKNESFCGWYFKCQSAAESLALIPAVHTVNGRSTCSVQLITDAESRNFAFSGPCTLHADRPYAKLGDSFFSEKGIRLSLHSPELSAEGVLTFGEPSPLRYDIMGPFCGVPFMECRHRVFSMRHRVDGVLNIGGKSFVFENGTGYIEGDRGRSFPRQYIWTQCGFEGGSLMLAAAEIPLGVFRFTGIIGAVLLGGREYRLATYLGARVVRLAGGGITVRQGDLELTAVQLGQNARPLRAPEGGAMTRTIHENIACRARYSLVKKGRVLLGFETERASFEYEYDR